MMKKVLQATMRIFRGLGEEIIKNAPKEAYNIYDKNKEVEKMVKKSQENKTDRVIVLKENKNNNRLPQIELSPLIKLDPIPNNNNNGTDRISILDKLEKTEDGQYTVLLSKNRQHDKKHRSVKL